MMDGKIRKNGRRNLNLLLKEDFLTGAVGGGYDNTMSPTSHNVQGSNPGYTYSMLAFNDTLQQKPNQVTDEYYIYPGCTVRGVGFNNPDKRYTGKVNRIVKNENGEVILLYIQTLKNSKLVSIRADENLELIIHKGEDNNAGFHKTAPNYNFDLGSKQ